MKIDALDFFMKKLLELKEDVLDIIFPPVCGICGKLDKNWICKKCHKNLKRLKEAQLKNREDICMMKLQQNKECGKKQIFYDKLFYFFKYKRIISKHILKYKFSESAYLSHTFSTILLKDKLCCKIIEQYDIIIPVPMFEKKKKQRGYNQTELIVGKIVKKLHIQLERENLIKIKNTKVQSTLSGDQRKENIKNAFLVNNKDAIKNKKIVVFDDIYTTGETANEIARVLKEAEAKEILILVLAKD